MKNDQRFQAASMYVLQEALEAYMAHLFEDSTLCTIHARCVTVMPKDIQLARCINVENMTKRIFLRTVYIE